MYQFENVLWDIIRKNLIRISTSIYNNDSPNTMYITNYLKIHVS